MQKDEQQSGHGIMEQAKQLVLEARKSTDKVCSELRKRLLPDNER